MNTWILSMKVLLISAGVVSIAMGLKFTIPMAMNGIPAIWSVVLLWMKPPYLYILINGIILTIAASSRFHHSQSEPASRSEHLISVKTPPPSVFPLLPAQPEINTIIEESTPTAVVVYEGDDEVVELKPVIVNGAEFEEEEVAGQTEAEADDVFTGSASTYNSPPPVIVFPEHEVEDVFIDSKSTYNTQKQDTVFPELQLEYLSPVREKPLVSTRFGNRRPIRTSPEAVSGVKALRVARPKRQETLESTWKMITEGRNVPLTRHLKKSDTWEHHARHVAAAVDLFPKSETFKERSNYDCNSPVSSKIRKEPSLSQDELNRRVEAFIKKFNEDMRLQRLESLNQYREMINRGV